MAVARNNSQIVFANISASPTVLALWSAATGGVLKGSTPITWSPVPGVGDNALIPVNSIAIEIPNGELTNSGSDDAVDGLIASTLYIGLHTASPPTASNQITADGDDRKSIATSGWTVSA